MKHGHKTNLENKIGHVTSVDTLLWQVTNAGTAQAEALVAKASQEQEPKAKFVTKERKGPGSNGKRKGKPKVMWGASKAKGHVGCKQSPMSCGVQAKPVQ